MVTDRFIRACLLTIILLLSVIAFRPFLHPDHAHAAQGSQYKVIPINIFGSALSGVEAEQALKQYAADGWELTAAPFWINSGYPEQGRGLLIFRK